MNDIDRRRKELTRKLWEKREARWNAWKRAKQLEASQNEISVVRQSDTVRPT